LDEAGDVARLLVRRRPQPDGHEGREVRAGQEPIADRAVDRDEPDGEGMAEGENLPRGIGDEHALARLLEVAARGFEEERLPEADTDEAADGAAALAAIEDGLRR